MNKQTLSDIKSNHEILRKRGTSYPEIIASLAKIYHYSPTYMRKLITKARKEPGQARARKHSSPGTIV